MKKYLLFFAIFFLVTFAAAFATVSAQEPLENPDIPDPLEHYKVKEEMKGILQKLFDLWKPINERGVKWWEEQLKPKLQQWWGERKEDIKQGLQEEKEELKESIKEGIRKTFSKLWEKIKEIFKREASEAIESL